MYLIDDNILAKIPYEETLQCFNIKLSICRHLTLTCCLSIFFFGCSLVLMYLSLRFLLSDMTLIGIVLMYPAIGVAISSIAYSIDNMEDPDNLSFRDYLGLILCGLTILGGAVYPYQIFNWIGNMELNPGKDFLIVFCYVIYLILSAANICFIFCRKYNKNK